MISLRPNLVKRIERLPKPSNTAGALQPLFEAVSNSIHSTQAKFGEKVAQKGNVIFTISTDRKKKDVWATVEDNGTGLDNANWEAFTTTDTDNKIDIGGKGVGRLLWLDCFADIEVSSVFSEPSGLKQRSFKFVLSLDNQISKYKEAPAPAGSSTSFHARFSSLRNNGYFDKFPGRGNIAIQHFTSHFLPTFIGGRCPTITINVGDESRTYPEDIDKIVYRRTALPDIVTEEYGTLKLTLMECDKVASADLKGYNFIHFIAHDRTVESLCIDSKLGLKIFGENEDRVFHAVLTGKFLDTNVNQERTSFNFEDVILERIVNDVCYEYIEKFLSGPIGDLKKEQRDKVLAITQFYPSVAYATPEELQEKLPSGELADDAIYGHLSRERFRRDRRQSEKIENVLARLKDGTATAEAFAETIKEAGKAIEDSEQRSLAEYVVRRKVVLDFIEVLLEKVRDDTRDSSYQREDVLHSFICPLRVNTLSDGTKKVEAASSHDLWIVDERLTFARYFSSDTEFSNLSSAIENDDRPDVLIFDHVHGLCTTDTPSKILLVEFKRPGRTAYPDDENPQLQVERYIRQLQSGQLLDVRGRPIKIDEHTIFYCFIVADILGKLDDWTYTWRRTVDGRGRIYRPDSGFVGSIELMGWDALLSDARARNRAFFDQAGIEGKSYFSKAE